MTTAGHKDPIPRFAALRHRDFRLLWLGQMVSMIGSQMQFTTVNWHVYALLQDEVVAFVLFGRTVRLAGEALGLGILGLVRVAPIVLFALVGGVLADTRDRRKVMLVTQAISALLTAAMAVITLTNRMTLASLYLLTAGITAAWTVDNPSRQALIPNLVPRDHLTNVISLNTLLFSIGSIVGPTVAGVLIGRFHIGVVYAIDAFAFGGVITALLLMNYRGRPRPERGDRGLQAIVEGWRFTHGSPIIWGTMLLDFFATFFSSARTMLPIVAGSVLKVGPEGYGLLVTAQPVGSVLAGAVLSARREIQRQGPVLLVAVGVYGLATALFGLSTLFALSYVLFALTGAGDTVSTVIRGTIRQIMTPDHLRGRMTGFNMIFFMGGPNLGELEAGLVAALFGAPFSIVSGGVATVLLTLWVAWKFPHLRHYTGEAAAQAVAAPAPQVDRSALKGV